MPTRIAINGFGRMGRLALRAGVFALNCSVHSYLVLAYWGVDRLSRGHKPEHRTPYDVFQSTCAVSAVADPSIAHAGW